MHITINEFITIQDSMTGKYIENALLRKEVDRLNAEMDRLDRLAETHIATSLHVAVEIRGCVFVARVHGEIQNRLLFLP